MKKILLSLCFIINFLNAQNSLSDINGNTYEFLNYGTQSWTVENAVNESYRDGTPIPQVTDQQQWSNLTTGAWCYFSNNPAKGKLYNCCLLYTSPSPRDTIRSRMPSSA